ncbi:MAG: SDR family oxidoreductase, partial [Candidatus Brocadiaceae bacterium]
MRVLVTGGSGLLGSRMLRTFPPDWDVTGTCASRDLPGLVRVRLEDGRALRQLIQEGRYDWIVHCAAIRSPDVCARDSGRAIEVNSVGTECVALAAEDSGARLAYASTDYVFPGDDPPYGEDDRPAPLNVYGHSKLAGEQLALRVPGGLVVRMPALYSLDLEAPNNVLGGLTQSLREGREVGADDEAVRYYTLAEEVAAAFMFLMREHVRGIVHVSASDSSTK